jgi:hypothetical protein
MLKLPASQLKENVMSMALGIALYLFPGLALSLLRRSQGMHAADALFCGLFWPFDVVRDVESSFWCAAWFRPTPPE